jgi:D-hexose-6-phosphate mutarotase
MGSTAPQHLTALARANRVRLARAELKRRIAVGETSAADVVVACPWEVQSMTVADLLASQRRWGATRCRKLLAALQISETRHVGALTERQRLQLAERLSSGACREPMAEDRPLALL